VRIARPAVLVSLAAVFFSLPIILYGFPVLGHDGLMHRLYCREFASQFWSGEWYPRWLMGPHHGLGSPAFFVYGPVPFYITSLIAPLGRWFGKPPGYLELSLAAVLALWCSGIAAYLWLRRICGETAAMVGAVVYLASPYHLTVDLYMRAAFAELWAFVWMPLILYFTEGVMRKRRGAPVGVAVSLALLAMTHLLTTLMFSPVPLAYAWFLGRREERGRVLATMGVACLLGTGLAAIYLLPALEHRAFVSSAILLQPVYQWPNNFPPLDTRLFRVAGQWPSFVQFVALVVLLFAAVVICLAAIARGAAAAFWLAIAGISLFMMLSLSAPVWRLLPILAQLQFPWRFQAGVTLAVAALAALSFGGPRFPKVAVAGLGSIAVLWLAFFGYMSYLISRQDHQRGWTEDFSDDPFMSGRTGVDSSMEPVRFESGGGSAKVERWAPRDIRVRLRCERDSSLLVHQFYYPGWRANVTMEASGQGLIRVKARAGEYELRLWLDGGRMETVGKWVRALSVVMVLVLWVAGCVERPSRRQ
jgi:hypothetical protein